MSKLILEPMVLFAILIGLVMLGLSMLATIPRAWIAGWAVVAIVSVAQAIFFQRRHRR